MTDYPGIIKRISVTFIDSNGDPADPTAVTLKVKNPAGTETSYTYAAEEITKSDTGDYYKDLTIAGATTSEGVWYYRWEAAGAIVTANEGNFTINDSEFY